MYGDQKGNSLSTLRLRNKDDKKIICIIDQKEAEIQGKFKKTEYDLIHQYNNKIAQKLNEMESFKHNIEIQYKKESLDSIEAHKKEINTYYNNLIADHMNQYNDAKLRLEDEKKVLEKEYQSKILKYLRHCALFLQKYK